MKTPEALEFAQERDLDLVEVAPEARPMQEGRNMTMMMAPSKAVLAGRVDADGGAEEGGSPTPEPEVAGEADPEAAEVAESAREAADAPSSGSARPAAEPSSGEAA